MGKSVNFLLTKFTPKAGQIYPRLRTPALNKAYPCISHLWDLPPFPCNKPSLDTITSGAARISSRGRPKFFEQHSLDAVVKPSESSRNKT